MGRSAVPVTTLSDMLGMVGPVLSYAGDATPALIGKAHLERGIGTGPRIVFLPAPKGKWGPPPKQGVGGAAGYLASVTNDCVMLVRGMESGDDASRLKSAEELAIRAMNVVRHLGPGRTTGGDFGDDSPLDVDAYGADLALSFTYTWPVPSDPAILAAIAAAFTPQPLDPQAPNGRTTDTFQIDATTAGSR